MVEGKARKVERWNWTHIYHENERTSSFSRTYWEVIGNDTFTIDMTWLKTVYFQNTIYTQTFYVYLRAWWMLSWRRLDERNRLIIETVKKMRWRPKLQQKNSDSKNICVYNYSDYMDQWAPVDLCISHIFVLLYIHIFVFPHILHKKFYEIRKYNLNFLLDKKMRPREVAHSRHTNRK